MFEAFSDGGDPSTSMEFNADQEEQSEDGSSPTMGVNNGSGEDGSGGQYEGGINGDGGGPGMDFLEDNGEENASGMTKRKLEDEDGWKNVESSTEESMDGGGPTPAKKAMLEINVRKLLPDLEKHWKPVEDDPSDFTAWTYLLQYVDQENELLAAREAYDTFLARYPYCYGYWKKYADYEKRKGSAEDCEKVFHRGLKAISLSVDLWIHYLNYVKATHDSEPEIIRAQFETALDACGIEFRSDKLWEHYIQWERDNSNIRNVFGIYDRLIRTPTQSYQVHFQNMKELISQYKPSEFLSPEEHEELRSKIVSAEAEPLDEEAELSKMRDKITEIRSEVFKQNEAEITARWTYEEAIKRPYFHVKPLEKGQLKMWKEYLDFEIEKGDMKRIFILFERCLIACALYEEYWIKYARFLLSRKNRTPDIEMRIQDVFMRACTVHHPNKPWINLCWASYEESRSNVDKAIQILDRFSSEIPDSLIIYNRRINLERRRGNLQKCVELYRNYIDALKLKNKANAAHFSIKFALFLQKMIGDIASAQVVLQDAVDLDESTRAKVIMALVDLGLSKTPIDTDLVLSTFNQALSGDLSEEQKVTFAHRKIEFLELYGSDVESVDQAQDELQSLAKVLREKKAAAPAAPKVDVATKNGDEEANKAAETPTSNGGATYDQYAYSQQYNQYGNYANWNYQQSSGYGYGQQGWNAYQGYYGGTDSTTGA